jgi:hypothetical protein
VAVFMAVHAHYETSLRQRRVGIVVERLAGSPPCRQRRVPVPVEVTVRRSFDEPIDGPGKLLEGRVAKPADVPGRVITPVGAFFAERADFMAPVRVEKREAPQPYHLGGDLGCEQIAQQRLQLAKRQSGFLRPGKDICGRGTDDGVDAGRHPIDRVEVLVLQVGEVRLDLAQRARGGFNLVLGVLSDGACRRAAFVGAGLPPDAARASAEARWSTAAVTPVRAPSSAASALPTASAARATARRPASSACSHAVRRTMASASAARSGVLAGAATFNGGAMRGFARGGAAFNAVFVFVMWLHLSISRLRVADCRHRERRDARHGRPVADEGTPNPRAIDQTDVVGDYPAHHAPVAHAPVRSRRHVRFVAVATTDSSGPLLVGCLDAPDGVAVPHDQLGDQIGVFPSRVKHHADDEVRTMRCCGDRDVLGQQRHPVERRRGLPELPPRFKNFVIPVAIGAADSGRLRGVTRRWIGRRRTPGAWNRWATGVLDLCRTHFLASNGAVDDLLALVFVHCGQRGDLALLVE